ncbi:MAG TPA: hypothetical protein VGG71_14165 [Chitinophagaceae bacterium]
MKKKKIGSDRRPPGYRQKLLAELKSKYPHYILKSNLLGGFFLLGLILTIWEMYIYRVTFISVYVPISIWIITGLIMTPLFKKIFNIYCFNPYTPGRTPMFFHYLYNIVSFGGILVFLFMWINQTFNDKTKTIATVPIVSYGHLAKTNQDCGQPYANIMYNREEKELIFPCDTKIEKYNSVYIAVAKGFFGFEVITDESLIAGQW